MRPDDGIQTYNFDTPAVLLHQAQCPQHGRKERDACHVLPDGTQLYCRARIEAARLRTNGANWVHVCVGGLPPSRMRLILPTGAHCFNCGTEYVPVPPLRREASAPRGEARNG